MKTLSLLLLLASAVWGADPACLSGPVTLGNVTITCSMIDNTDSAGSDPGLFGAAAVLIFQVRITSSDPDVIGMRLAVTSMLNVGTAAATKLTPVTEWRSLSKTCSSSAPQPVAGCDAAGPYVYRYSMWIGSPAVTSIQVQELKPVSSQTF